MPGHVGWSLESIVGRVREKLTSAGPSATEASNGALIDFRIRESLADEQLHPRLFFRSQQAALNAALDGIEQFEPVFERWLPDGLPLIVAALAGEETPLAAYVLDVNLEWVSLRGRPFPAYFRFRHGFKPNLPPGGSTALWQVDTGDSHGSDALLTPDESQPLIRRRFYPDFTRVQSQRCGDVFLHGLDMRKKFGLLRDDS